MNIAQAKKEADALSKREKHLVDLALTQDNKYLYLMAKVTWKKAADVARQIAALDAQAPNNGLDKGGTPAEQRSWTYDSNSLRSEALEKSDDAKKAKFNIVRRAASNVATATDAVLDPVTGPLMGVLPASFDRPVVRLGIGGAIGYALVRLLRKR